MARSPSNRYNFHPFEVKNWREYIDNLSEITRLGHEVFECIQRLEQKPTAISFIKEGLKLSNILLTKEIDADEYFYKRWNSPFPCELNEFIIGLLREFPVRTIKVTEKNRTIKIADVHGEEIGWIHDTSDGLCDGLYVKIDRMVEGRAVIKKVMWDHFGDKSILLRRNKSFGGTSRRDRVTLEVDDQIPPLKSETAHSMAKYLKRCIGANVSRSLLFYGPPGTGKSTMVRCVTDSLKMRTLRIRVEDISDFENSLIFEVVDIFKPDAIIMDDLDRAGMMHHLLEMMEFFQRHVKLIMATVNDKNELGEAMLRPGRFDELIEVKYLDDGVILTTLGEANTHLFDLVKKWPIKYIEELVTRRRFMDEEEAVASLTELQKRVDRLKKFEEDDDEAVDENKNDEDVPVDLDPARNEKATNVLMKLLANVLPQADIARISKKKQ
jgi:ATPase family associated with various cellular activities (AAA)